MYELRRWVVENRDRAAQTLSEAHGKPADEALLTEIFYVCGSLGFWAKKGPKSLADERVRTHSPLLIGKKVITRYRPYGVVGVIGPWNYPLTNNFGDAIPALVAGNSVVLKPSHVTPLTSMLFAEGFRAAGGPEDVFSVATGSGGVGGRRRDDVPIADRRGRLARQGRCGEGRARVDGRQARRGPGPLLRAHRARGRGPLDGLHDRGDLRPDASHHEGPRRGRGDPPGQRLALWPRLERLHARR